MKLTSRELRQLYQQHTARREGQPPECLGEDLLVKAATRSLTEAESERVADHLVRCAGCSQEYQQLKALKPWAAQAAMRAEAGVTPPGVPASSPEGSREVWAQKLWNQFGFTRAPRLASAIAALAVVAGVSLTVWRSIQRNDAPTRNNDRGETVKKINVEPADESAISDVPQRLSWSGMEPADSYRVVLYDFESTPIWESDPVKTTSIALPVSVLERLPRGQKIYWRVLSQNGVERRQSDLFAFTVAATANR